MRIPFLITIACLVAGSCFAADPTISVVIPARKPSRPAHFNWRFKSANGEAVRIGQFACGSYWVAPAKGDDGVKFVALTGKPGQNDLLSCDDDPITERHGLLSSKKTYGNYDANENLLPKLPVTLKPKSKSCISLVAAMQRNEAETSKGGTKAIVGNVVDAYCVVTIMPRPPRNGGKDMIRPNITGAEKEFLTWDDFDLNRLPKYPFLTGRNAKGWEGTARRWRSSIEIFGMSAKLKKKTRWGGWYMAYSEGGRAYRSCLLVPDYASGTARSFNDDLLSIFAAGNSLEEMKPGLAAMLAYGLDIYHARYNYGTAQPKRWTSGAGQWLGQFLPPVFAAALSKNEKKAHQLRKVAVHCHTGNPAELAPQELCQIKRGPTGVLLWGDAHIPYNDTRTKMGGTDWRYWADFHASKCWDGSGETGNPHKGKKTAADPYGYIDGPANKPGTAYMNVSFGGFRAMAAAMILMPHIRSVVNSDAPIEYADRIVRHGLWTWPDPVAPPTEADRSGCSFWWSAKGAQDWGKLWGPNPKDIRFAIENGKGRFKSLHGRKTGKMGYEVGSAVKNWGTIIALYKGRRFEDNMVPVDESVAPEILFETGGEPKAHIRCSDLRAVVHYTDDGSKPTGQSPVYTKPIPVTSKTRIRAFARVPGKRDSEVRSGRLPRPLDELGR